MHKIVGDTYCDIKIIHRGYGLIVQKQTKYKLQSQTLINEANIPI